MITSEAEDFAQSHDVQGSAYWALRGHQYESSTARLDGLVRMKQRLRAGRVHERQAAEIEAKFATAAVEAGINGAFELRSRRDVQLAGDMKSVDCPVPIELEAQETIHRVDPPVVPHPQHSLTRGARWMLSLAASTRTPTTLVTRRLLDGNHGRSNRSPCAKSTGDVLRICWRSALLRSRRRAPTDAIRTKSP